MLFNFKLFSIQSQSSSFFKACLMLSKIILLATAGLASSPCTSCPAKLCSALRGWSDTGMGEGEHPVSATSHGDVEELGEAQVSPHGCCFSNVALTSLFTSLGTLKVKQLSYSFLLVEHCSASVIMK